MSGHRFFSFIVLFCVVTGFLPRLGFGAPQLPPDVRNTTNASSAKPKIEAFLTDKVAALGSAEASRQSAAREAILAEVQTSPGGATAAGGATPAFYDAYADVLSDKLKDLAKSPETGVRLNVAVIASRVSEKGNNSRFMPILVDLLGDQNEAVVLWAVKGSKYVLPSLLNSSTTARTNPLIPAFTEATKKYIKSGWMIQSAYDALRIEQSPNGVTTSAWPTAVQIVVPVIQDLLTLRLEQYKLATPELPRNETSATTFLTDEKVWKAQAPPMQAKTSQLVVNLVGLASQRAAVPGTGTNEGLELRRVIQLGAGGLSVVGKWTGVQSQMEAAVKPLTDVKAGTSSEDLQTRANALVPSLNKIKAFANIQPAPKIQ